MKVLRAILLAVAESILIPFTVLFVIGYICYLCVVGIRYKFTLDEYKEILADGLLAGARERIKNNILFVKYGKDWWWHRNES